MAFVNRSPTGRGANYYGSPTVLAGGGGMAFVNWSPHRWGCNYYSTPLLCIANVLLKGIKGEE
jgi:hypothetical protein